MSRTKAEDHLGNQYASKKEMCDHYHITTSIFFSRIGIGWSIKDALTTPVQRVPKNAKFVTDHTGQKFSSISKMCAHWHINKPTYTARIQNGWSVERALTEKTANLQVTAKTCKDHLGNEYASQNEMCRAYHITKARFTSRIKLNWSLERALTEPIVINAKTCQDGFGHTFPSAKDLCNYYNMHSSYLQGKDYNADQINTMIRKHFKKNRKMGETTILKEITYPYYLVSKNAQEIVQTFDQILLEYHNSDYFKPIPKTKVKIPILIERVNFPYYKINNEQTCSYWEIINQFTESNFGLSAKEKEEP